MKKSDLFILLARPNNKGVSRWVKDSEFTGKYAALRHKNGLDWGRASSELAKKYNIEIDRSKTPGNSIDRIRLNGFRNNASFCQTIRSDIKSIITSKACVMLGTKGGSSTNMSIEVDHKDGRKNNMRVSNLLTQKIDDFQPLCKAANDFKRQKCKECKSNNIRWSASILEGFEDFPFYEGDEHYTEELGCVGCYLYDPVAYRRAFKKFIISQTESSLDKKQH